MAEEYSLLSARDTATLKELVQWWRTFTHRNEEEHVDREHQSPEVCIVKVPVEGIPAIDPNQTQPGTAASITDIATAGDTPGRNVCPVYQIVNGVLSPTGESKTVYNLSFYSIPGNVWIKVTRDKWGSWLAPEIIHPSFVATTQSDVTVGAEVMVLADDGQYYSVQATFGAMAINTIVWVSWDFKDQIWRAIQIPCPA